MPLYIVNSTPAGSGPVLPVVRRQHDAAYREWIVPTRRKSSPRPTLVVPRPRSRTPTGDVRLALTPTLALHLSQVSNERS